MDFLSNACVLMTYFPIWQSGMGDGKGKKVEKARKKERKRKKTKINLKNK